MGHRKIFEIAHDGCHLQWECKILEYEGHRILVKELEDVGMDRLLGKEVCELPVPDEFPEQLPFEQGSSYEMREVAMPSGSLRKLCARRFICSERDWPNSTATAISFGMATNERVLGPVIAEFEMQ
jgi:hypothetical protein